MDELKAGDNVIVTSGTIRRGEILIVKSNPYDLFGKRVVLTNQGEFNIKFLMKI